METLFEEFCHFLRAEKEAAPRTIETYRWFFKDYAARRALYRWNGTPARGPGACSIAGRPAGVA